MTDKQIELLLADQPLVVYDHDKKKKGGGGKKGRHSTEDNVKSSLGDVKMAEAKFAQKHGLGSDGSVKLDFNAIMERNRRMRSENKSKE